MAISDKHGTEIKKQLESHQAHGMWGDSKYIYGKNQRNLGAALMNAKCNVN